MSTEPRAARGALLTLLATLSLTLSLVLPSGHAHAAPADGAVKDSPGEKIARGLRASPVHVDPAYADVLPPAQRQKLAAQIERSGIPIRIIVVPSISGDAWDGDPRKMADVVRDRLGESRQREAVYMTLSSSGDDFLNGYEYPDDKHQAFWAVAAVGHLDEMKDRSLYAKFSRAIDIVKAGNGDKVYKAATKDLDSSRTEPPEEREKGVPFLLIGALVAGLAVLLLAAWLVLRILRHRARGSHRVPYTSPHSVFASAREADARDLRGRAQHEVVALGEELGALDPAAAHDPSALQLALDAYAAAGTVLDAAEDTPDLAGVLALVHESRQALTRATRDPHGPGPKGVKGPKARKGARGSKGESDRLPLCFFHPLHGPATGRLRWRPLGRRDSLHVAACDACADAVARHRPPEVLTAPHEGRPVPYFEIPADRSLWAATGYGSLGEESLTARVARGDHTRARDAQEAAD